MIFNRKKKATKKIIALCNKMISGVDKVKLILYTVLSQNLFEKEIYDNMDQNKYVAAAAVNDIFNSHNDTSKITYKNHQQVIEEILKELGETNPELKQIITDALRVYVQANWALGSELMKDMDYVQDLFKRSRERGLFIEGGDNPNPDTFIKMTDAIAKNYGINE